MQVMFWLIGLQVRRVIVRCESFDGRDECWKCILIVIKAILGNPLLVLLLNMGTVNVVLIASPSLKALQTLHARLNLLLLRLERLFVQNTDFLFH